MTDLDHMKHLSSVSREEGHLLRRVTDPDQMLSEPKKERAFQNVNFTFPAKTVLQTLVRHKKDVFGGTADW
jgi:hypothetical protein